MGRATYNNNNFSNFIKLGQDTYGIARWWDTPINFQHEGGNYKGLTVQEYLMSSGGTFDNDTLSTGNGSDEVYGYTGDDTITIDGLGSKIIDGGVGTDTLNIDIPHISSMDSFSKINLDTSTGFLSFTSNNGDVISVKNIEKLYQIVNHS